MRWWMPIALAGCYSAQSPDLADGPRDAGHDGVSPHGDAESLDATQMTVNYQVCFSDSFSQQAMFKQNWVLVQSHGSENEASNTLILTPGITDPTDEAAESIALVSLTNATSIRATVAMNPLGAGALEEASLILLSMDGNVLFGLGQKNDTTSHDHLHAFSLVNGVKTDFGLGAISYSNGVHKVFRITVDPSGLVHFESSGDGVAFTELTSSGGVVMPMGVYAVALSVRCDTATPTVSSAGFSNAVLESSDCAAPTR